MVSAPPSSLFLRHINSSKLHRRFIASADMRPLDSSLPPSINHHHLLLLHSSFAKPRGADLSIPPAEGRQLAIMGGSHSCFFSFRPKCRDDGGDRLGPRCGSRKVRPSDEDRGWWVGEPDVDSKAAAFIAKFHEARLMDLERQQTAVA